MSVRAGEPDLGSHQAGRLDRGTILKPGRRPFPPVAHTRGSRVCSCSRASTNHCGCCSALCMLKRAVPSSARRQHAVLGAHDARRRRRRRRRLEAKQSGEGGGEGA